MRGNNRKIQNTYIPTRASNASISNYVTHNNEGSESDEDTRGLIRWKGY